MKSQFAFFTLLFLTFFSLSAQDIHSEEEEPIQQLKHEIGIQYPSIFFGMTSGIPQIFYRKQWGTHLPKMVDATAKKGTDWGTSEALS